LRIVGGTDMTVGYDDRGHASAHGLARTVPTPEDVHREARRRLARMNFDGLRARALVAGYEMPRASRYLAMQIEFVSRSLAALQPIPDDFADDLYWPR
jgi:hypothetical protein